MISQISNEPIWSRVIRYECSTATPNIFLDTDLSLNLMISSLSGSTTLTCCVQAAKIVGIKFTGIGDGTGVSTIVLRWSGDRSPDKSRTFMFGPTIPEKLMFRPPPSSLCSFWFDSNAATGDSVFTVDTSGLNGCLLMDLHLNIVLGDPNLSTSTAVGSAEQGLIFPSLPISTGAFVPPGVSTT